MNKNPPFSIFNCQLSIPRPRKGMTLVELMVVITIMVIMVAVSIPTFKPMLESQRAAGAARVVAGTLQRVRVKAMQDQKTYGLEFVRFETAPNTSVQLRLMREQNAWATPEDLRVVVINGTIHTCSGAWNGANWEWTLESTPDTRWTDVAQTGNKVQFGRQGRFYELASPTTLKQPYQNLTLPDGIDPATTNKFFDWAAEATVTRPAAGGGLVLAPPVVLPRGTIVDFKYSGKGKNGTDFDGTPDNPAIMFSPAGFVDGIRDGSSQNFLRTNEMVYFCVGEWERQDVAYTEDGKDNLQTPSNFWVTVHPKSGQVRVTQFASGTTVEEVRKFATEHFVDVGGF